MLKLALACLGFFILFNFLALTAKASDFITLEGHTPNYTLLPIGFDTGAATAHITSNAVTIHNGTIPGGMLSDEEDDLWDLATPGMTGFCDIEAVAFARADFNNPLAAQTKCDDLVKQTVSNGDDCKVVKHGKRFQARFRRVFQQNQEPLGVLLNDVSGFIQENNIFSSDQIKVQLSVTNGCS